MVKKEFEWIGAEDDGIGEGIKRILPIFTCLGSGPRITTLVLGLGCVCEGTSTKGMEGVL